jgi:hypothetical protein
MVAVILRHRALIFARPSRLIAGPGAVVAKLEPVRKEYSAASLALSFDIIEPLAAAPSGLAGIGTEPASVRESFEYPGTLLTDICDASVKLLAIVLQMPLMPLSAGIARMPLCCTRSRMNGEIGG